MKIPAGSKIKFEREKQRYTVIDSTENFTICTKPLNKITRLGGGKYKHEKTYMYTIIDWPQNRRGPDNLVFGSFDPYNTKSGAKKNLENLERGLRESKGDFSEGQKPSQEVSYRRDVKLDIEKIIEPKK